MGIEIKNALIRVMRLVFLPFRGDEKRYVLGTIPHWRRYLGMLLGVGFVILTLAAMSFGFVGEWRAMGFMSFAALGFWLGAQELVTP